MKDSVSPDDSVICGLCGHETSIAMIVRHLDVEHGVDPEDISNAEVIDATGSENDG